MLLFGVIYGCSCSKASDDLYGQYVKQAWTEHFMNGLIIPVAVILWHTKEVYKEGKVVVYSWVCQAPYMT